MILPINPSKIVTIIPAVPANTTFTNCSIFAPNMYAGPGATLVSGQKYEIVSYTAGDDFTNLGGTNVTGNIFTATGTLPNVWIFGSVLRIYEAINGIGTNCEFYNTSIVGASRSIDNSVAVNVKFTTGMSSAKAAVGPNVTLT